MAQDLSAQVAGSVFVFQTQSSSFVFFLHYSSIVYALQAANAIHPYPIVLSAFALTVHFPILEHLTWLSKLPDASAALQLLSTHLAAVGFHKQSPPVAFLTQAPWTVYEAHVALN